MHPYVFDDFRLWAGDNEDWLVDIIVLVGASITVLVGASVARLTA